MAGRLTPPSARRPAIAGHALPYALAKIIALTLTMAAGDAVSSTLNPPPQSHPYSHHAGQAERQGQRLRTVRSHKQNLLAQGMHGWELMEAMTTMSLEHRESMSRARHRCQSCWFDATNCICHRIQELHARNRHILSSSSSSTSSSQLNHVVNVKLLLLMHPKEYLCAGNSAKLLRMLLPEQEHSNVTVQYYIFGKVGDVDKLAQEMMIDKSNTMILWPDKDALTVSQFLERQQHRRQQQSTGICFEGDNSHSTINICNPTTTLIRAVVLDGTYTQARNMHTSLRKHLNPSTPLPVLVQLRPMNRSVFHRAHKNYGHAHQSQQQLQQQRQQCTTDDDEKHVVVAHRVSTAEACGQLLLELGASSHILHSIIEGVIINNEALGRQDTLPKAQDG